MVFAVRQTRVQIPALSLTVSCVTWNKVFIFLFFRMETDTCLGHCGEDYMNSCLQNAFLAWGKYSVNIGYSSLKSPDILRLHRIQNTI